jgi:hypothetical protein
MPTSLARRHCDDYGSRPGKQRRETEISTGSIPNRSYEDNTMIRIISAFILAMVSALCCAAGQEIQLADGAPSRHVVVPGDTCGELPENS